MIKAKGHAYMASTIKEHRSFGLLVGGIFALIGFWPLIRHGESIRVWAVILGSLLMVLGLLVPGHLAPIYKVWMAIGHVLGWINTRIILGIIYYGLFTPMGLVMRLWRQDSMRRQYDQTTNTYRVLRQRRPASHMLRQF
jgi:Saxitoxin biosynthesis operon protein SxtJ